VPAGDDDVGHESRFAAFFDRVGAMVMGRTTYEWVLANEQLLEQPEKWRELLRRTRPAGCSRPRAAAIDGPTCGRAGDVAPIHADMVEAAGDGNV
jgi:hypothetical protein